MALTSVNSREAVKRRKYFEPLATDRSLSPRRRRWAAMRWFLAEAAAFPPDEAEDPADELLDLVVRLNETNAGRRTR